MALNKPAFISSTDGNSTAELAVNGDIRIHPKLCARTTNQWGPWLVGDLQAEFLVAGVTITNGGSVLNLLLPPATKLGQGYIFTGVGDSVLSGGLPQCVLGYHAHPPGSRHSPGSRHPQEQTLPRTRHPPEQTPSQEQTPPRSRSPGQTPPGIRPPLAQSMLGDTVNAWAVRILLECNLVTVLFF